MDITGVESPSAYEGLLNCDEKNPKPSIIAKQTRPELEERLEATLGIIVSCYKGRFCSWICRKINGSSRPDPASVWYDLPGSLRWQNTASASEPQQNVNSKKRRGSRHHSPILESSRTTSRPRTRSLQYSPAEVMILSRLIQRNPLEHHFTQETKLTRLLHPRKQHPGSQGAGRY